MEKAIVVFTKVPKVGEVKTRLTEARGGILTPQEANALYEACMLDVIDVSLAVEEADIYVCYNKDGDRTYLDSILTQVNDPEKIKGVYADKGGTFDDCIQYATDFILKSGTEDRLADEILLVGGDLPTLQPWILQDALNKVEKLSATEMGKKAAVNNKNNSTSSIGAAIAEGSCQEGGFSIVAFTCTTPFNFYEVFYNKEGVTALDMLVTKSAKEEIPFAVVEMVPDIDIPVDLGSAIPALRALELAAKNDASILIPKRTLNLLNQIGLQSVTNVRESL